jgi:hypothetical protein
MTLRQAKEIARQWVLEEGIHIPGFRGAFYHGSANYLPDDAVPAPSSDLDIMVVLADPSPPNKLGKFIYQDIMLEVSYLPADRLQSPEAVLTWYHMAGSFRSPSIISDPSGQLTQIHTVVSREFAKRHWVTRRCEGARDNALGFIQSVDPAKPFHAQVISWLFGAGVTTHVLLVAGLKNPTVRRRYAAARELLAEYGHLDFYGTLLELLGCAQMSRVRVEHHLAALTEVFDAAKAVIKTPFPFASDITDIARPIAIDGSRDLVERGLHREAVFWIVATYARCQNVLFHDAPVETQDRFTPGFRHLVADLGITSYADLPERCEQVRQHLPHVWEVAEAIMAANPEIEDEPATR